MAGTFPIFLDDINIDLTDGMMGETPHYVILDEENRYWFISAIMTNKIAMYSLDTNEYYLYSILLS